MARMLSNDVAPAPIPSPGRREGDDRNERFIRLLTEHQSHLFVYLVSLLGDVHEASNVLQETNLVLWRRSAEFAEGTNFGAWARTIAHYQLLAYLRDRKRDRHVFDADLLTRLAEQPRPTDLQEARRASLRSCLAELPDGLRQMLSLRYSAGVSIQELTRRLGKSESAVKMTLARTRQRLMECIQKRLATEG